MERLVNLSEFGSIEKYVHMFIDPRKVWKITVHNRDEWMKTGKKSITLLTKDRWDTFYTFRGNEITSYNIDEVMKRLFSLLGQEINLDNPPDYVQKV